jgi:acetyl-CoA synthetase
VDDVINVSGHRIGTAEVESALVGHHLCAEAAVVPVDHAIKGQAIYAFVTLMGGHEYPPDESVRKELIAQVGCGERAGCIAQGGDERAFGAMPPLLNCPAAP